ncbi:Lrp/AsnC family transcriptional regulator [Streptomyces malaysiensis]|uniref:Lrp/AsnC family transcriptional regulator n=1 Tax=Streptomyces malaysiensis subsp. samsunensis TaxID=459658 RepID=A0A9X2RU06_STRMQ|nr:Lrp/AsnC family transcriptional regulator [Streptomyces samsunensis]MCQ8828600.1 Lrp/AsnC family transcriptional regulator [Streptomyces samsunensis]
MGSELRVVSEDQRTPEYGRSSTLSELEQQIIGLLQQNARASYAELARQLSVTEKTVRGKVTELLDTGIIEFTIVTDPAALGYGFAALIGVQVSGDADIVAMTRVFSAMHNVDYVVAATGRYPIYVEALTRDSLAMLNFVNGELRRVPGVTDIEVFPYLRLHYQEAQYSIARSEQKKATSGVRPSSLDDFGRRIVQLLSTDGRMSFRALAQKLEVAETTARQHVQRMTAQGVFRPICLVNPLRLGFRAVAWLAINAAPTATLTEVADMLAGTSRISYVAITAGRFDVFAEVVCADNAELMDFLEEYVRTSPLISAVETSIYMDLAYKPLTLLRPDADGDATMNGSRPEA